MTTRGGTPLWQCTPIPGQRYGPKLLPRSERRVTRIAVPVADLFFRTQAPAFGCCRLEPVEAFGQGVARGAVQWQWMISL